MKKLLLKLFSGILFLVLTGCGSYFNQPTDTQEARLGETTPATQRLKDLALPKEPVVVGVYKFRDQTGQYKQSESGGSFSTAVTQGGTTILVKALEDSKWFMPIERENLANLLNERNIIAQTRKEYRKTSNPNEPQLPPLLFAGIILEGGIMSYDTNIITGGLGARYFGIGSSTQYRQDRITVYLRAVSTTNGKILKTVYISKTILSQAVDASVFRYVKFKRLLEAETGFTKNEPVQLAVTEAIEKSVEALIIEGIEAKLWSPQATEGETAALLKAYKLEEDEAIATKLYDRFITERRGKNAVIAAGGLSLMNGDYADAELELNTKIGYKQYIKPYLNLNFTYNKFNLANKEVLNEGFMSFDLNAEVNILPYDKFTPYVFGGFGTNASNYFKTIDPKMQVGLGFEYLIANNIGLTLYGEHNYVFSDELDFLEIGSKDDMYYRFGAGVNIYFTQPSTKFNEQNRLNKQKQKELRAQKKLNTKMLKENRKAELKAIRDAKKNNETIINTNKIENDEN